MSDEILNQNPEVLEEVVAQEKMVPQSQVNSIVREAQARAAEKARREAAEQFQGQQQQMQQPPAQQQQQQGYDPAMMQEYAAKAAQEHYDQLQQQQMQRQQQEHAQNLAIEFLGKLDAGKSKYPDFEDKVREMELDKISHIVQLANATDNTADVIYDLANNPSKIANLTVLAYQNPKLAQMEMRRLSESIRHNETVGTMRNAPEPLTHIRPSNLSSDSGTKKRVSDLRRQPNLRA